MILEAEFERPYVHLPAIPWALQIHGVYKQPHVLIRTCALCVWLTGTTGIAICVTSFDACARSVIIIAQIAIIMANAIAITFGPSVKTLYF